jgi:hypothetical protein
VEVDGADVVAEDEGARGQRTVELVEELTEPSRLSHAVGHGAVLGLGAGAGDNRLALRRPGDEAVAEEHGVARGGPACVGAARPVGIGVDAKFRGGGPAKKEPEVKSAPQVPQNPLQRGEMRLSRVVHVKAHLLDGVGDVGPGEEEVLKGPGKTPVAGWIGNRGAGGGEFALCVHWSRAGLAVNHASTFKDVDGVLPLVEEQTLGTSLDGDPQEVVERPEVLHRKLPLETGDDATQKLEGGGGEDDVVDVEEEVRGIRTVTKDEQGRVRLGLDKTLRTQEGGEATVPSPGCLLEAVEGLVELADHVGLSRVDKPNWLGAVDRLRQGAVEEGVRDVELVDRPVPGHRQGQNSPDGGRLDHRTEGLVEVDPRALSEAPEHIAGLVPLQGPIGVQLQLEDPLPGDHIGTRGSRHQVPGVVGLEGLVLRFHGAPPLWVGKRTTNSRGYRWKS